MEQFKKWLKKECDEGKTMYPSSYDDCEDAWRAALNCVRDKMLPSCECESIEMCFFIKKELGE